MSFLFLYLKHIPAIESEALKRSATPGGYPNTPIPIAGGVKVIQFATFRAEECRSTLRGLEGRLWMARLAARFPYHKVIAILLNERLSFSSCRFRTSQFSSRHSRQLSSFQRSVAIKPMIISENFEAIKTLCELSLWR